MRYFYLIIFIVVAIGSTSCQPDDIANAGATRTLKLQGVVQKGPFISDSKVTIQQYDDHFNLDSRVETTVTVDDAGNFSFSSFDFNPFFAAANRDISHSLALFEATGFYYDETTNERSEKQITLRAVADLDDFFNEDANANHIVNINILTTLASNRIVRYMRANNRTYEQARALAEVEVMNAFGITLPTIKNPDGSSTNSPLGWNYDFKEFDLSSPGFSSGALLAVSSLFIHDQNQDVGDILEIAISSIENTGSINASQSLKDFLIRGAERVDTTSVLKNLREFYEKIGITFSVNRFSDYVRALDIVPPTATFSLTDQSKNVSVLDTLRISFSEIVRKTDNKAFATDVLSDALYLVENAIEPDTIDIKGTYDPITRTAKVVPANGFLKFSTTYTFGVRGNALEDLSSNVMKPVTVQFDTELPQIVDTKVLPLNNSVNIDVRDSIIITFNKDVKTASGEDLTISNVANFVEIVNLATNQLVLASPRAVSARRIVFKTNGLMAFDTKYQVRLKPNVLLGDGNSLINEKFSVFTTEKLVQPTVSIQTLNDRNLPLQTIIENLTDLQVQGVRRVTFTFSESIESRLRVGRPLDEDDLKKLIIFRQGSASGPLVDYNLEITADKKKITMSFGKKLKYQTSYHLRITNIQGIKENIMTDRDILFSTEEWSEISIDGTVRSVYVTADNHLLVGGDFRDEINLEGNVITSKSGSQDCFVALYDPNGELLWYTSIGEGGHEELYDVQRDANGNIYVTGSFSSNLVIKGIFMPSQGLQDIFVYKYEPVSSGYNVAFANVFGGVGTDRGLKVDVDLRGNVYLGANFEQAITIKGETFNSPSADDLLIKMDNSGDVSWAVQKTTISTNVKHMAMAVDKGSGIVYFGGTHDHAIEVIDVSKQKRTLTHVSGLDLHVISYNIDGSFKDIYSVGGVAGTQYLEDIIFHKNSLYITGYLSAETDFGNGAKANPASQDAFVLRTNDTFTPQWLSVYASSSSDEGLGLSPMGDQDDLALHAKVSSRISTPISLPDNTEFVTIFGTGGSNTKTWTVPNSINDFAIDSRSYLYTGGLSVIKKSK